MAARACLAKGDTKGYDVIKRSLPSFCFMCTFEPSKGAAGNRPLNTWRSQKAVRLNGLVMLDFDHLDDPRAEFARLPEHFFDDDCVNQILLAHITPSGSGLRLVCKADPRRGNIADNQNWLSRCFGLTCDKSVKNADRTSFAVMASEIIYLDPQLFTYNNEEFDNLYGDNYRLGKSQPLNVCLADAQSSDCPAAVRSGNAGEADAKADAPAAKNEGADEGRPEADPQPAHDEKAEGTVSSAEAPALVLFRNVPRKQITEAWLKIKGTPEQGERHLTMVAAACDLRYICDNQPKELLPLLLALPFVQDIVKERGQQEVEKACTDACNYPMKPALPKTVKDAYKVCKAAEQGETKKAESEEADANGMTAKDLEKYTEFWNRLQPLISDADDPYNLATYRMADENKLGGVFAAGAMFCTLMTRCWYRHFNGEDVRMNPQVYLIGDPASGKGETEKIDQIIMSPVLVADRVGREAEAEYKRKQKERATSSKAQKGEALQRPEFCIRYLPSRTSNAVFFRRAKNAYEEHEGEKFFLHLYTFDSELDSNTTAQSGGSWIGKHDIELKAFHNEVTGVDYANADSVNEIITIYYNSVVTGTPISLAKKISIRNVNDGLCSRLAIFRMLSSSFRMIGKGDRNLNHAKNCRLKEWAFKFDKMAGELKIGALVDHVYNLCEQSAYQAEATNDKVLDFLRKRAVFYAIWFTVPRIVARAISVCEKEKREGFTAMDFVAVNESDFEFATLIYDAVIYWQDYFFGRMLQESWENAMRELKPRAYNTNNSAFFMTLPKNFTAANVVDGLGISNNAAYTQISRWIKSGYVSRVSKGEYVKNVSSIEKG